MILGNEGSVEKKIGEQILFKAKLVLHGGLTITDMNCELMICMQKHGQLAKDAPMAPNSLANHLGNFQVKVKLICIINIIIVLSTSPQHFSHCLL